jgi:hypothetical protein
MDRSGGPLRRLRCWLHDISCTAGLTRPAHPQRCTHSTNQHCMGYGHEAQAWAHVECHSASAGARNQLQANPQQLLHHPQDLFLPRPLTRLSLKRQLAATATQGELASLDCAAMHE